MLRWADGPSDHMVVFARRLAEYSGMRKRARKVPYHALKSAKPTVGTQRVVSYTYIPMGYLLHQAAVRILWGCTYTYLLVGYLLQ
jgi:hypothetical protein